MSIFCFQIFLYFYSFFSLFSSILVKNQFLYFSGSSARSLHFCSKTAAVMKSFSRQLFVLALDVFVRKRLLPFFPKKRLSSFTLLTQTCVSNESVCAISCFQIDQGFIVCKKSKHVFPFSCASAFRETSIRKKRPLKSTYKAPLSVWWTLERRVCLWHDSD